jgi:hypothetical protein
MESSKKSVIGFSTGAIAYSDFQYGLQILREQQITAVEISALRMAEWVPLIQALDSLDLSASRSKHDCLSYTTIRSFQDIAHMIPGGAPDHP